MPDHLPNHNIYAEALADCASATRHDGWTRECKVTFCEVLAITGRVIEALDAVNKSANTAYAQRRRDPLFAAAWELALTEARHRLADALLTRAFDGTHVVTNGPDGACTGHRVLHDNRLALALLRRLDRLAETGRTTALPRPALAGAGAAPAAAERPTFTAALAALRAAPDLPDEPETHETHMRRYPLANARIDGEVRPHPIDRAPPHTGDYGRQAALCEV
jgi:hypothetical protein